MLNRLTIFSLVVSVALIFDLLPTRVWAKGCSFPIEGTGVITNVDRATQVFTIEVDEPASVLTIGLRNDCKFKRKGAPAGIEILRRGARVKASYYSTLLTGRLAVEIDLNPIPELRNGIVERIERAERKLTVKVRDCSHLLVLRWTTSTCFVRRGETVSSTSLRENTPVRISYYSPAFESKYAVKIELEPAFLNKTRQEAPVLK